MYYVTGHLTRYSIPMANNDVKCSELYFVHLPNWWKLRDLIVIPTQKSMGGLARHTQSSNYLVRNRHESKTDESCYSVGRTSGHCRDPRSITIVFSLVFTPASHHVITTAPVASSNHNKCIHASESHANRK